jgi:U4/U6 small nuclear ribonucleoprotein PRP31
MSTVVEDLLNDFGSSGDEADDVENNGLLRDGEANSDHDEMDVDGGQHAVDGASEDAEMNDDDDEVYDPEATKAKVEKMQLGSVKDVRTVASLMHTLEPVLEKIKEFQAQEAGRDANLGNIEDHPEYTLLTQCNGLSTQIDGEIMIVHKYIRDHYSARFPELEGLVTTPLEYAKVVAIIGNGPMDSESIKALQTSTDNQFKVSLKGVLDGPSLMIVTVEATTSKGRELSSEELHRVRQGCEMTVALHDAKRTLRDYVQSRMSIFAPNLTALIGALTGAQLLNAAGGLTGLSKTPACNIASWGSKKRQAGLSTNIGIRQQGFLYNSDMIRSIPTELKKQAMRIVSNKLVLAARVDRVHSQPDGSTGEDLKRQCLERLEKLTEPPPNKGKRALPVPDDKPARKRGGRRARKAKEALAMTDLRKAQNRMAFGKEEKEVGYGTGETTVGMGMIGQGNDGRIRGMQVDQRTRAKLGAKSKGWGGATNNSGSASSIGGFGQAGGIDLRGKGLRSSGVGSTVGSGAGTQSSLAFTPVQGLELVDPKVRADLSKKRKAEEDRWFKGGTFTQVGGNTGTGTNAGTGGFKVPDVPAAKRVDTGATKMGPPPNPKS